MCAWSLAGLWSQLHSQPGPHKTVRCPPDPWLNEIPSTPQGQAQSSTRCLINTQRALPPAHSSRSSLHSQAPRSRSLGLLSSDQMYTPNPQAEKMAPGTHLGNRTCSCSPCLAFLYPAQYEAAAQSPCLSPTPTPPPHPLSFIFPGRISVSPLFFSFFFN